MEGESRKRFIIEFGMGMDLHGQDISKAAAKAVKDAVSRSCLCGLEEVLGIKDLNTSVEIEVTVAVSRPEEVDDRKIKEQLPIGSVKVEAVKGGLTIPGLYIPALGDNDNTIEAALACVEVFIL
ncbi:Lin0512 family protein [Gudongella oleilytica]|uniref:Lin0512 family protein n=1 Tax=Gudongella oleilytica TaxID=1582259 RepID=UPI000FF89EB5|nr:Lin0512 family protein [Gudongella oleilytica]